jgi:ribose transport system permease protein
MILAAGQLFVVVTGGFDLSQGSLVTLTVLGGRAARLRRPGQHLAWVIARPVRHRSPGRTVQRRGHSFLRVPSFITTLGMLLTLKGFALLITGGAPRGALPDNFRAFGRAFIEDVPLLGRVPGP